MKYDQHISFETERLRFTIVSNACKQEIFEALTPEVAKYLPFIPSESIEGTQGFIDYSLGQLAKGEDITFVARDKKDGSFVGCCGIHDINEASISLGIWLKASTFGKGFGTEIIVGLERFVNDNLGVSYLIYNVVEGNEHSIRIAEKLGYVYHHSFIREISKDKILNTLQYRKDNAVEK